MKPVAASVCPDNLLHNGPLLIGTQSSLISQNNSRLLTPPVSATNFNNICGRIDDVLLSSCDLVNHTEAGSEPTTVAQNTFAEDEDKPDLLQMIVDDEIKQFL